MDHWFKNNEDISCQRTMKQQLSSVLTAEQLSFAVSGGVVLTIILF